MSSAILAFGSSLNVNSANIAEVTSISIAATRDHIDVTHHASTAPGKEFIAGLLDCGQVTMECNFLPQNATHQTLTTDLQNSGAISSPFRTYILTWPNGTTWAFVAMVINVGPVAKCNDKLSANVTFKITRSITIT